MYTTEFDINSTLNWPGSWGSSDPEGLSKEDAIISMATNEIQPYLSWPADACQAAEAEAARVRRLAEVKAQQLRDFQAREAARVRAYRRQLALLHTEAAAGSGGGFSSQTSRPHATLQSQEPQRDWNSLRSLCQSEVRAARRALVGKASGDPQSALPPPPPALPPLSLRLLDGFEDAGAKHKNVDLTSARSRRTNGSTHTSVSGTTVTSISTAAASAVAARRHRAAQRSLSALSEREAARRWRRRLELRARSRRVKAEGEAALQQRLAEAETPVEDEANQGDAERTPRSNESNGHLSQQPSSQSAPGAKPAVEGSSNEEEGDDESSIVSVTELTHTVLTLSENHRPAKAHQADPPQSLQAQNCLAFLRTLDEDGLANNNINGDNDDDGASLADAPDDAWESHRPSAPPSHSASLSSDTSRWRWLRQRSKQLRLHVPPLCPCCPDPWRADVSACAMNCMFRGRPALLLAGVADYVRSADPSSHDWWPAFSRLIK